MAEIDKEAFSAAIVHDMRAPLNACLMSLSLIELKASQPGEVLKSVEVLRRNLERQALLIDDLGDALQMVGGGLELELEGADLVDLVDEAVRTIGRSQELRIDWVGGRPGPCPVLADRDRLARAIGTALESIAGGLPPGGRIELGVTMANGRIRLDIGRAGAPSAEPSSARKRPVLRMTVAHEIVEKHGGRLDADEIRAAVELPAG